MNRLFQYTKNGHAIYQVTFPKMSIGAKANVTHVHSVTNDVSRVTLDGNTCRLQMEMYTYPFPLVVGDSVEFKVSATEKLLLGDFKYITRGCIFAESNGSVFYFSTISRDNRHQEQ